MALITEVLSQGQFRELRPDPSWAVVAIINHDEIYPPPTDGYAAALELMFDDVGDGSFSWLQRWKIDRITTPEAFETLRKKMDARASQDPLPATPWHALTLYRFIRRLKRKQPNLQGVRVYCEYGKSRSPLAAAAIDHWWKNKSFTAEAINPGGALNDRWARLLANVSTDK